MQAEIGRLLDDVAANPMLPEGEAARKRARALADSVPERYFPVRFNHPNMQLFRTLSIIALVLTFLLILFLSVQTAVGSQIGASAIIRSGPLITESNNVDLAQLVPVVGAELAEAQLRPVFRYDIALLGAISIILLYILTYMLAGLGFVSFTSLASLRQIQAKTLVTDNEGVGYSGTNQGKLRWEGIQERVSVDWMLVSRPLTSYSHQGLFGEDGSLDIPGQTANYESILSRALGGHIAVQPRQLGISLARSWAGALFLMTLGAYLLLIVVTSLHPDWVTRNLLGPYALSDFYIFLFLGFFIPLGYVFVLNPLREAYVLRPTVRWPLWLGGIGLAAGLLSVLMPPEIAARLVRPNVYPPLLIAFLVACSGIFFGACACGKTHLRTVWLTCTRSPGALPPWGSRSWL